MRAINPRMSGSVQFMHFVLVTMSLKVIRPYPQLFENQWTSFTDMVHVKPYIPNPHETDAPEESLRSACEPPFEVAALSRFCSHVPPPQHSLHSPHCLQTRLCSHISLPPWSPHRHSMHLLHCRLRLHEIHDEKVGARAGQGAKKRAECTIVVGN